MLYGAWQSRDDLWLRLQWALQRPLLDVAAAGLLWLCVSGRTPRLARFLGAKVWRPLAAVSYSCYLMQSVSCALARPHVNSISTTAHWARIVILLLSPLALFIITLPLGLLLYSLVEHPGILFGRYVISASKAKEP